MMTGVCRGHAGRGDAHALDPNRTVTGDDTVSPSFGDRISTTAVSLPLVFGSAWPRAMAVPARSVNEIVHVRNGCFIRCIVRCEGPDRKRSRFLELHVQTRAVRYRWNPRPHRRRRHPRHESRRRNRARPVRSARRYPGGQPYRLDHPARRAEESRPRPGRRSVQADAGCTDEFLREEILLPGHGVKDVMPGIRELLPALQSRDDISLGLLTGNFEAAARIKLGALRSVGILPLRRVRRRCWPDRNQLVPFAVEHTRACGLGDFDYRRRRRHRRHAERRGVRESGRRGSRWRWPPALRCRRPACNGGAGVVLEDLSDVEERFVKMIEGVAKGR